MTDDAPMSPEETAYYEGARDDLAMPVTVTLTAFEWAHACAALQHGIADSPVGAGDPAYDLLVKVNDKVNEQIHSQLPDEFTS